MPRRGRTSLLDKLESVSRAHAEAELEFERLRREEDYLTEQIAKADEQVRYYQNLLIELKSDWGRDPALRALLRRLE
jgi:DNA/RNA-binding domain of Phe-tRNA-synthetase-like protein